MAFEPLILATDEGSEPVVYGQIMLEMLRGVELIRFGNSDSVGIIFPSIKLAYLPSHSRHFARSTAAAAAASIPLPPVARNSRGQAA